DRKSGRYIEETETHDISNTGLTLRLRRRVRHGAVLHLCLPMPMHLRNGKQKSPDYSVYGLVRRVEPAKKGSRIVALEFIGENPPRGYLEKPWALFRSAQWGGVERRRTKREQRRDAVWLEYFSESMQCIRQEAAMTEDVSSSGMRVFVKAAPIEFEIVRVSYPNKDFETFAVLVNRFVGQDKIERLCLRFVDLLDPIVVDHKPEQQNQARPAEPVAEVMAEIVAEPLYEGAPAAEPVAEPVTESVTEPTAEPVARTRKILVADDDMPLRKVMGKILTQAGYDVILAEDGKAAVEKAATEKPDLVITDGLMPKLHGFLVCKAVKEMDPPPKVILVTAVYTKMNYKWEVKDKYGADALITKPFEVADLLACIQKQLADSPHVQ
ncbi:MAG TPA: response regulator, partial [Blastocatellia bacterium]|nr:response regulator [Blastocatellia bacterium]